MRRSNSRMAKMWKSRTTSILSISTGTALAILQHSKMSHDGLLKSLLVETGSILPKRVSARYSSQSWGCVGVLHLLPSARKAWPWKVKESKLLRKNISLPLTIPLMVLPWGKLLLCAFLALISLRYCHNPQI